MINVRNKNKISYRIWQSCVPRGQVILLLFIGMSSNLFAAKIHGYVTNSKSPELIYIGNLEIHIDKNTKCVSNNGVRLSIDPAIYFRALPDVHYQKGRYHSKAKKCAQFAFKVGTWVGIDGRRVGSESILAYRINVFAVHRVRVIGGRSLLEEAPEWHGGNSTEMFIDGYPITVEYSDDCWDSARSILSKNKNAYWPRWVEYSGTTYRGNIYKCSSLILLNTNIILDSDSYKNIPTSGNLHGVPEEITLGYGMPIRVLQSVQAQEFIGELGDKLIPRPFVGDWVGANNKKIHFRFLIVNSLYAIREKKFMTINGILPFDNSDWGASEFQYNQKLLYGALNAIALPNGTILIPSEILCRLHNEAQLAALLSYSIASVLQDSIYRASIISASNDRFDVLHRFDEMLGINEQVLRLGIRQMYLAGYDIREAPYAWAVAQGKSVQNPIINSKHPDQEIPWYAAYAFNYISQYYQDADYSKLKRGEREYQQFLQELYKADPSLPRPKSQPEPQVSPKPQAAAQPVPQSSPATRTASAPRVAPSSATSATMQTH